MRAIITPGYLGHMAEFYYQLARMVSGGLRLIQSLEMIRQQPPHYSFRKPLTKAVESLNQGYQLHEAFRNQNWLPEFDIALIEAGEKSGRLDTCLRQLSEYYNNRATVMRTIIGGLAYPVVLLHLAVLIFPTSLFGQFIWKGLVDGSVEVIRHYVLAKLSIFLVGYGLVLLLSWLGNDNRSRGWRAVTERLSGFVPWYGKARKSMAMGRLALGLEALLAAGVVTVRAWELAALASGSPAIIKAVEKARLLIQGGELPGNAIAKYKVFPQLFVSLYRTGEASGKLDDSLGELRQNYLEQGTRQYKSFGEWLPRVLFIGFAVYFGYQIITFYMGYFGGIVDSIDRATQGEFP